MDSMQENKAIEMAAGELHKQWRDAYQAQNGEGAERWKPMKPESVEWVNKKGNVPSVALREGEKGPEINIAALDNNMLPPQFSSENTASAAGAIKAIKENKNADIDSLAAIVHEQWLDRNGSWAAEELKKPYAELAEAEKEKDRIVVKVAQSALQTQKPETGVVITSSQNTHIDRIETRSNLNTLFLLMSGITSLHFIL